MKKWVDSNLRSYCKKGVRSTQRCRTGQYYYYYYFKEVIALEPNGSDGMVEGDESDLTEIESDEE